MTKPVLACAIYTRKSSEEGLEQDFNSLDAQRESCAAYVASQKHEGWKLNPARYDDGGFSGGNMDRPALKRLLADINAGKIDVVVVYKVDRLTRSLADFAKIVETFDGHKVSFVSVTQAFNTTSSMGRLTLNVLLSFAQFEREVTGERIRDKIAASKAKGMWMGGLLPLGYDTKDRKLVVNEAEAKQVRDIFARYADLGSVRKLKAELDRDGIKSKPRLSATGNRSGGVPIGRGALYTMLGNPVYIGNIRHRQKVYPGQHQAILDAAIWQQVQERLAANKQDDNPANGQPRHRSNYLLAGLLHDAEGRRFASTYTKNRGHRYRYYVQQAPKDLDKGQGTLDRLRADDLERIVLRGIAAWLSNRSSIAEAMTALQVPGVRLPGIFKAATALAVELPNAAMDQQHQVLTRLLRSITVVPQGLTFTIAADAVAMLGEATETLSPAPKATADKRKSDHGQLPSVTHHIPLDLRRRGSEMRLVLPADGPLLPELEPDATLLQAIARAYIYRQQLLTAEDKSLVEIGKAHGVSGRYIGLMLRLTSLAPEIVTAILDGAQPVELTVKRLLADVPINWDRQRRELGFGAKI